MNNISREIKEFIANKIDAISFEKEKELPRDDGEYYLILYKKKVIGKIRIVLQTVILEFTEENRLLITDLLQMSEFEIKSKIEEIVKKTWRQ